ncbi:MAG: hypothetical protein JNJ99_03360 [Crocinitomicaceae bacterium]|nr:hypothetical protein [Crocinitomicaceae bacterium]
MKRNFLVILTILTVIVTSCGVGPAEETADEFHKKLDAGEYDYIVENLIDEEILNQTGPEVWYNMFDQIEALWGKAKERKQDFGFKSNMNNGVTTVQLDYVVEFEGYTVYERMFLVDRGKGSKISGVFMNEDKATLEAQAGSLD